MLRRLARAPHFANKNRKNKGIPQSQRRKMLLEPMEERRLLAADFYRPEPITDPEVIGGLLQREHVSEVGDFQAGAFQSDAEAEEALQAFLAEHWGELFGSEIPEEYEGFNAPGYFLADGRPERLDFPMVLDFGVGLAASRDATNVRIPGIDEPDSAEFLSNGMLFVSHENQATIFDVSDPQSIQRVSSFELEGYDNRFMTFGDTLVALSHQYESSNVSERWSNYVLEPMTVVTTFDLSDVSEPVELGSLAVAGRADARLVGDQLMLGLNDYWKTLPELEVVESEAGTGLYRFETETEYFSRLSGQLVGEFLPDLEVRDANSNVLSKTDIGDFEDLQIRFEEGSGLQQYSIVSIDLSGETPTLVDGETIFGASAWSSYVDSDSYYAVSTDFRNEESHIQAFGFDGEEVWLEAAGSVPGFIRSSHAMDEHDGTLRVFTSGNVTAWRSGDEVDEANLFLLQAEDGELEVVGELIDIAPGESQLGSVFDGDLAYITTGAVQMVAGQLTPIDPLHVFDLSSPAEPVELSELDIPGLIRNLRKVGDSHLVGFGWDVTDEGEGRRQVTLFDISDKSNPQIVENWLGEPTPFGFQFVLETFHSSEMDVRYDDATSLLVVDGFMNRSTEVFQINVGAGNGEADSIEFLGEIEQLHYGNRTFVVDGLLYSHQGKRISVYSPDDLSEPLGTSTTGNPLYRDHYRIINDTTISPMDNDHLPEGSVISALRGDGAESHRIREDGLVIIITMPAGVRWQELEYDVTLPNGDVFTQDLTLYFDMARPPVGSSDATVELSAEATDGDGNTLTEVEVGDTVWVTISADREGLNDAGIFAGYFDVSFGSSMVKVISTEALPPFENGFRGELTEGGITGLGGFSGVNDGQSGPNAIARFQMEIIGEGNPRITVAPSLAEEPWNEFLVFGEDRPVNPANVSGTVLELVEKTVEAEPTDVNKDGTTSPVDALILTNELNRRAGVSNSPIAEGEYTLEDMDVNGDNALSAVDILLIINQLNRQAQAARGGEGEQAPQGFSSSIGNPVDAAFDLEEDEEDGSSSNEVPDLSAAFASVWDLERRK